MNLEWNEKYLMNIWVEIDFNWNLWIIIWRHIFIAQDPNSETPYVGKDVKIYGNRAPEAECPICEVCPDPRYAAGLALSNILFPFLPFFTRYRLSSHQLHKNHSLILI